MTSSNLDLPFVHNLDRKDWNVLRSMTRSNTNSPETSSMGRLFDAMSSLLGLRNAVNYEGQAAIEMEAIADRNCVEGYEFEVTDNGSIIKAEPVIKHAIEDLLDGVSPQVISAKFHLGVADLITSIARKVRAERHLNRIALSGGVFQNMFLAGKRLPEARFGKLRCIDTQSRAAKRRRHIVRAGRDCQRTH